jgi:putative tryptophan/tyrosine transport system substrate-binding protein
MRRREFIAGLAGAAVWRPRAARGRQQQTDRMRRIAVLAGTAADDPEQQARIAAFVQGLSQLGWNDGRNARIDIRWATTDADEIRRHAVELVALSPDVILAATGTATTSPLLQATRTLPIVFVVVIDPVGAAWKGDGIRD